MVRLRRRSSRSTVRICAVLRTGRRCLDRRHCTDLATCSGSQPRSRAGISAACGDPFFGDHTRPGWLLGLGIEYMFARNWSAKIEYDYMDFGHQSVPFSDGNNGFFTEDIHQKINLIKVGLNYHFDFAATPPL